MRLCNFRRRLERAHSLRSTTNVAICRNGSARSTESLQRAMRARFEFARQIHRALDSQSSPDRSPCRAPDPCCVRLPICSGVPSTSSRSSITWNASPSARAYSSSDSICDALAPPSRAPPRTDARNSAPVFLPCSYSSCSTVLDCPRRSDRSPAPQPSRSIRPQSEAPRPFRARLPATLLAHDERASTLNASVNSASPASVAIASP